MKKLLVLSILCCLSILTKGQVYQLMPQYGYDAKRMNFDSTLSIPTVCGVPTIKSNKTNKAAIAYDSCNNRFYYYNPKTLVWDFIKSVDTTSLSNRINLKLNISDTSGMLSVYLRSIDTTNKWVNSVTKLNDSTIHVVKGTTTSNITISSVTNATRLITQVWNNTGVTIPRGSVVYISGRHSSNLPTIAIAEANNENNSYKTFALVSDDISDNSSGYVIQAGKISGLNLPTSSYTDGDIVYLSSTVAGGYTTTKPLAPNHIVKLGSVTRAHPTQGSIEIKIENGWQLDELSDVQIPAVPNDSALLQFSRVDSLWHSVSPINAIGNRYIKPSDTTAMLSPYLRSNVAAATYATISQNNAKLNISDTATMLSPYIRSNTANATFATSVFRKTASDSVFFVRGGSNVFAFRDSLGTSVSAANPTASVGLTAVNGSATTFMRSDAAPALDQSIAPTWTGLHTFSRSTTASGALARGTYFIPTLTAAANNDTLATIDIRPTFANGAFTGVQNIGLNYQNTFKVSATALGGIRLRNNATPTISNESFYSPSLQFSTVGDNGAISGRNADFTVDLVPAPAFPTITSRLRFNSSIAGGAYSEVANIGSDGNISANGLKALSSNLGLSATGAITSTAFSNTITGNGASTGFLRLATNSGGALNIFPTGNVTIQTAGTYTDAGYKLDVNGTTRIQNKLSVGTPTATSAVMEITSTTQGFMPPRMTTTQRDAISSPAAGLIIYNTTTNKHQGYNGTTWNDFY